MDRFNIYIHRLKQGQNFSLDETLPPDFIDIQEEGVAFPENIRTQGEAYLADDHLIIHLNIVTAVFIACSICNEAVRVPIVIKALCLSKPLEEIKTGIFDCAQEIRESILLQVPQFVECHNGGCPARESLQDYLVKKPFQPKAPVKTPTHFPFADLDL